MRRTLIAPLLGLAVLACKPASNDAPARSNDAPQPEAPEPERNPADIELVPPKKANYIREDLLGKDLPPAPKLESMPATVLASGELPFPEGTDELAPRVALALGDGLLLAGQAYLDRRPGTPPQTWRWTGFIPTDGEPRSTLFEQGAIRAGIADEQGGLLTGTRGVGFPVRGWFGRVDDAGEMVQEIALETPNSTEMFDLVPGVNDGEQVVLAGYVDAQGWLISLDIAGRKRWEKYIGSHGSTQVRAIEWLHRGDLLVVGSRAQKFGEAWFAVAPGDGGPSAAPDDVTQAQAEPDGADPNRMLRAIVRLGDSGFLAFGTARRNHLQAHDQLLAIGLDANGVQLWARVLDGVRVTDIHGARAHDGQAQVLVSVPLDDTQQPATALARVTVGFDAGAPIVARQLTDSAGWTSAGFIDGSRENDLLGYAPSKAGVAWRRLTFETR